MSVGFIASPAAQAAIAATVCRLPGSWARCVLDQKAGVNAAPQSVMIKREAIMASLNLLLSMATQTLFKLPIAENLKRLPVWGKYETLIRAAVTIPGMLLTECLSRKGAYGDLKLKNRRTQPEVKLPQGPLQTFAHNPFAMGAVALATPMVLNAVQGPEFGAFPQPIIAPQNRFISPLYY